MGTIIIRLFILAALLLCAGCSGSGSDSDNSNGLAPVIHSFSSGYSIIFPYNSQRDFAPLQVNAEDSDGEIVSIDYEIISDESRGYLYGMNSPTGMVYWAGSQCGEVEIKATVTDDSGLTAEEILTIYVKNTPWQKISDTEGGFSGTLDGSDYFGHSTANIGDLNGDGVADIAIGAPRDDDGDTDKGAVWILFLNPEGTVKSYQKISTTEGGFSGILGDASYFGQSITGIGDLDGDGIIDIAVGASNDDDGINDTGALWILFLNADGTVKAHQKITNGSGGFTGLLEGSDYFGGSVAVLGDIDGDGVTDIAVGACYDDDGDTNRGAVWILFLNSDGTVKSHQKISDTEGDFTGILSTYDWFGKSITSIGDLDNNGTIDLAVGADGDNNGGSGSGAVWILFLNADGTVTSHQKISSAEGNFFGSINDDDWFGRSITSIGDLDNNGTIDLAVGAPGDNNGGDNSGAVYILFLYSDGTVKSHQKISSSAGDFSGVITDGDFFGSSITDMGDIDSNGVNDITVGAYGDDDGDGNIGAVWILLLDADGTVPEM